MRIIQTLPTLPGDEALIVEGADTMRWLKLSAIDVCSIYLWETAVRMGAIGVLLEDATGFLAVTSLSVGDELSMLPAYGPFPSIPTLMEVEDFKATFWTPAEGSFVHLHTHSEYSPLDGLSTMRELADRAAADGNTSLAVTDHGVCSGHPSLQRECDRVGIKPIFGLEAYFVDDRITRPESGDVEAAKRLRQYKHLILLAKDDEGLKNIWAMSTEGFRDGFYYKPRIDWDTLRRHAKGVIATSACLGGPVSRLILDGRLDEARAVLGRFLQLFGSDFYLEIQPGDQEDQRFLNEVLVEISWELGIPLVAAADGHFPSEAERDLHKTWLACQTGDDNEAYWHFDSTMTEKEMRERLSYLSPQVVDEAIANTIKIAKQCNARIESKTVMPVFYKQGGYDRDAQKVREMCEANWSRIKSTKYSQDVYRARFEYELEMITRKQYCGYFLMVSDYVCWAKDNGVLVGPGRGSGAGSLIAYLMRITEVDPVHYEIIFERFITEGRKTLPDFDVDFPASKREEIQNYIRRRYGDDHVLRVGTHLRYKSKGVFNKLFGVFRDRGQLLPEGMADARKISAIIEAAEAGTAGLGLSWDALWAQHGEELEPFQKRYPEIFALAERLVGRLNSYGKHPAGIVISTEGALLDQLPLRKADGDDGSMISQFEFDDLDTMGFIKFDILTIRTLDTLQETVDGAREHFGIEVNVYDFDLEYDDPMVWEEIGAGHTLGVFQIETASGTRLAKRMLPTSIADLADMGSIVRPGPMRSNMTESYLRRREGLDTVSFPDPRMEEFLKPTQGVMIYQEQLLQACMTLAGYDSTEADGVRKILGKKKVDQVYEAGQKFINGCVANGMELRAAEVLWDQMSEFAKYAFGKAHAISYAMITFWTAWWKTHYPVPALTALLSTVDKERVPEFVRESRRLSVAILPPDINISGRGFRPDGRTIRYGLDAIKGVGEAATQAIIDAQPYTDFEDYLARKGSKATNGTTRLLAKVGAFDNVFPNRRALVDRLESEHDGSSSVCVFKIEALGEHGLPCSFDWEGEPRPIGRTGKLLKAKPLPKKCTKACRQYKAPDTVSADGIVPYRDADIRRIEQDMLGVQLSSTAFDQLDDESRGIVNKHAELLLLGYPKPLMVAGTVGSFRRHMTRLNEPMSFFNLEMEAAMIDVVCFPKVFAAYESAIRNGVFAICEVEATDRGAKLVTFSVIES